MELYAAIVTGICIVQGLALLVISDNVIYYKQFINELKDELNSMQYELRKYKIEHKEKR